MKETSAPLPHINLIGDSLENFYALGLKDKETAGYLIKQMLSLVETPWSPINKMAKTMATPLIKQMFMRLPVFKQHIHAYADGLGRRPEEIALCYVLPEILSSMSKWLPSTPFGCSSFFMFDSKNECPIHGRILDFPLLGSFDKYSRTTKLDLSNSYKIFSYTSSGLPHPSLTSINSEGVSFAIHQKFTQTLFPSGTPIFEIVFQMLRSCNDLDSTLNYLKHVKSLTAWAFHLSFKNGDILSVDIIGDQKDIHINRVEEGKILYFNNELLTKKTQNTLPYGFSLYNQMRERSAQVLITKLLKRKTLKDKDLLMAMATPVKFPKSPNATNFDLSPMTPSSLDIVCMTAKIEKSLSIHTSAPRFYTGYYREDLNIFGEHERTIIKGPRPKTSDAYREGITECMKAQASIDQNHIEEAYHHFQIGIDLLAGHTERTIAEFFFCSLRFCHETHPKIRRSLLQEFIKLRKKLPSYLADHLELFIMRLELILDSKTQIEVTIQNKQLKTVMTVERKIPPKLLHKTISKLIIIRYDLLDFIYPYAVA